MSIFPAAFSNLSARSLIKPLLGSALLLLSLSGLSACSATSGGDSDPNGAMGGAGGAGSFSDSDLEMGANRFADGNIPTAKEGGFFDDIFFTYDSAVVPPEYGEQIRQNAKVLSADPSLRAEVEGHCDKRGTNDYNLALGEERARAVAALLVSYGVSPNQLTTISYGEEIPLDPGDSDAAFAKNRRVHFALYRAKSNAK